MGWKIKYREKVETYPTIEVVGRTQFGTDPNSGSCALHLPPPCYLTTERLGDAPIEYVETIGEDISPEGLAYRRDNVEFREVTKGSIAVCVVLTGGIKSAYYAKFDGYHAPSKTDKGIDLFVSDSKEVVALINHLYHVGERMCEVHPESGEEFIFADAIGRRVFIRRSVFA